MISDKDNKKNRIVPGMSDSKNPFLSNVTAYPEKAIVT
jgi:hypothetical protein